MQPLGSPELMAAYHACISGSHDYELTAEILDTEENVLSVASLVDGQIDISRDSVVHRIARVTLSDPDQALGLDSDSEFDGSAAADRMLRITHTVDVPGYGLVSCTPFVGPFLRVNRNGATIDCEAQDKTSLSIYGSAPKKVLKGTAAMLAIRALLRDCSGETRFRLPTGVRFRLRKPYSVGWADESSAWVRVQQIAHAAGMQATYSCDGYVLVSAASTIPVLGFGGDGVPTLSVPTTDSDFSKIVNYARTEADGVVRTAVADESHPFSPQRLGRNGVNRYLPSLAEITGAGIAPVRPGGKRRTASKAEWQAFSQEMEEFNALTRSARTKAQATSDALLRKGLRQEINLNWNAVPVFHLDYGDPIRITTPTGSQVVRFTQASIPLLPTADGMSVGVLRQVSRPLRMKK